MDIQVTGLDQVLRSLQNLPKELVLDKFTKAFDRSAGIVAAALEQRASALPDSGSDTPLHEHVVTSVEIDEEGRGGVAHIGFDHSKDERDGLPQDVKALLVEFGHVELTHAHTTPTHGLTHVPGYPFVRPAFEESAEKAIDVFKDTILENL